MLHKHKTNFPKFGENCYIEDSAQIIGDVTMGDDCSVWFNAVIRGDVNKITIGNKTNIQDGAVLHVTHKKHALSLGNGVTVGHGAILHGSTIGDFCLIGLGAKTLDGAVVEPYSMVAAGALVRQGFTVPSKKLVAGVPAKIIRDLTDEELAFLEQSAQNYIEYMKDYK